MGSHDASNSDAVANIDCHRSLVRKGGRGVYAMLAEEGDVALVIRGRSYQSLIAGSSKN